MSSTFLRLSFVIALISWFCTYGWAWDMPSEGYATMTHYDLPTNAIAACGCTAESDHYPTVALSALAYNGSDETGYGTQCGRCVRLQLINSILSDPPWYPANPPSIVVKITDKCPLGPPWCNATESAPNAGGHWVNFDFAWPSENGAVPDNWYPTNESYYGYTDMGVWNISYTTVSCEKEWAGASNPAAIGSVPSIGDGGCCPLDPIAYPNTSCPSSGYTGGNTGGSTGSPSLPFSRCELVPTAFPTGHSPLAVIILLCFTIACSVMIHAFLPIAV
ncbi:hypothetical protein DL93DRAFT_2138113 [Clavulina sp. PMI_390]|nr:hypothetical protein DL93DRAFT_2138113 [Clavulina sp. PMI_390]